MVEERWERVAVSEAARRLGITESAVRKRAARGQLRSEKATEGKRERLYILLDKEVDIVQEPFWEKYMKSLEERMKTLEDEVYPQQAIILSMSQSLQALTSRSEASEMPGTLSEPPGAPEMAASPGRQGRSQDIGPFPTRRGHRRPYSPGPGGGGCSVARRFDVVLYSPHASEQMRKPERNVSKLDVEETLRNPDRDYPSRRRPERTVAEKAFPSQSVVRVVYVVEPGDEAMEKYDSAMEKLYPGWREHSEALDAQLKEQLPVQEERERDYTVATVRTVIRMKRKQRTGDGGR